MSDMVAVVTDLLFQSKIAAAARAAARSVRFVTTDALAANAEAGTALVDLDASLDVLAAITTLKRRGAFVVAFGPHVDTAGRRAAKEAGADRVLAKSKFVSVLPELMAAPAHACTDSSTSES